MTTHVVIPVRDQVHYTISIVEQLKDLVGWDEAWIFDNGSVDNTWDYLRIVAAEDSRFHIFYTPDVGIYKMWDYGFQSAKNAGADYIAILNNDITLSPRTFEILTDFLHLNHEVGVVYPDYNATEDKFLYKTKVTRGTYRHGGMSGFCFVLRASAVDWAPLVDPIFRHWAGDDDIAFMLESRGWVQVRAVGLPVAHVNEGTARHYNLGAQKAADLKAVIEKWGR